MTRSVDRTIPLVVRQRVATTATANVLLVLAGSAIIAIAAQIAIPVPLSPVPLTMQPLAVMLVGITLGAKRGAASALLYLLEGASGLPVFAQGHGGAIWLLGPTAGYLYSYPFAAGLAGWLSERGWGSTIVRAFSAMLAALAVIYTGGFAWLAFLAGPRAAFTMGIVPFVIADLVKIALGATVLPWVEKCVANVHSEPRGGDGSRA